MEREKKGKESKKETLLPPPLSSILLHLFYDAVSIPFGKYLDRQMVGTLWRKLVDKIPFFCKSSVVTIVPVTITLWNKEPVLNKGRYALKIKY